MHVDSDLVITWYFFLCYSPSQYLHFQLVCYRNFPFVTGGGTKNHFQTQPQGKTGSLCSFCRTRSESSTQQDFSCMPSYDIIFCS